MSVSSAKPIGAACQAGLKDRVLPKLNHAIVFCDAKMAEVLHWFGGISTLLEAGATDVREFSSFESGNENQKKAVFLVSGCIEGVTEQILQDIITQSHFQYVIIFTSAHPLLHADISMADVESGSAFDQLDELVLEWMGNMNYTVEIEHVSLFASEVCPGFFIMPGFVDMFPLLSSDLQQINYQYSLKHSKDAKSCDNINELAVTQLPEELELQIRSLSTSLHGLFQAMGVKEDIYSIGSLSRIIATDLDNFPMAKARRKVCQSRLSLVLVDRTLDIASAVTSQSENLLDKVFNCLPCLNGHRIDRSVDMSSLCHCYRSGSSKSIILPGCLAPSKLTDLQNHLSTCILKKQKEALMDINRKLVETAAAEKLPLDLSRKPSRVTADLLDSTLSLFKGKYSLIQKHLETLEVAMATTQTLKDPKMNGLDNLVAKEKNIVQSIADIEMGEEEESVYPSALTMLSKIIVAELEKVDEEREFTIDDILYLLVYIYSLSDGSNENQDEIRQLQERLVEVFIKDKSALSPIAQGIVGDKVNETILADQLENMWEKLESLLEARRDLKEFGTLVDPGDSMSPANVQPLLKQIIEKIVDPTKPELPDIECKSGGLKDLLKSGFGFFKSSAKPRPGDAPILMILVIGGITTSEVKQVKDVIASAKPGFEVVVGGTRISDIQSTIKSLLVNDNINIGTD